MPRAHRSRYFNRRLPPLPKLSKREIDHDFVVADQHRAVLDRLIGQFSTHVGKPSPKPQGRQRQGCRASCGHDIYYEHPPGVGSWAYCWRCNELVTRVDPKEPMPDQEAEAELAAAREEFVRNLVPQVLAQRRETARRATEERYAVWLRAQHAARVQALQQRWREEREQQQEERWRHRQGELHQRLKERGERWWQLDEIKRQEAARQEEELQRRRAADIRRHGLEIRRRQDALRRERGAIDNTAEAWERLKKHQREDRERAKQDRIRERKEVVAEIARKVQEERANQC